MEQQHRAMNSVIESAEQVHLRQDLIRLQEAVHQTIPYDHLAVITGEQPYGALGTTKVLTKRLLAQTLSETYGDVTPIELFNNHDLVGSESRFFRLELPTVGAKDGIFKINLLTEKLRRGGLTAQGVLLSNETLIEQVTKARSALPIHYPSTVVNRERFQLDESRADEWVRSYTSPSTDDSSKRASYSDAHIAWLTDLEKHVGLEMKHIIREGTFDLMLLKNGGVEILNNLWEQGLHNLRDENYESIALKLDDTALSATPFNIAEDGVRLLSKYTNSDKSLIETMHPHTKETGVLTLDEALSGSYGISLKAVPRVVLYSLSGMDGHITGGGSVYNADAQHFMETFSLPYFPIMHMSARDEHGKIGTLQYSSTAFLRREHPLAVRQVREGGVSLLDLIISCNLDDIQQAIHSTTQQGGNLTTDTIVTIQNKTGVKP